MPGLDAIVVGLGAMGSAAVFHLADAGARVLGIDRLVPPHTFGSSHGDTRITRLAVGEGRQYVPLVRRSHELWDELAAECGTTLRVQCGGLVMGAVTTTSMHGVDDFTVATIEVARSNAIPHDLLDADEIRTQFGVFNTTDETGLLEHTAGYLYAEECVRAHLDGAARRGAELRTAEIVVKWSATDAGVTVTTEQASYEAGSLVLAAGPWLPELAPELAHLFSVERQTMLWFSTQGRDAEFRGLPVWIWHHGRYPGDYAYGFPSVDGPGGGAKCATETYGQPTTPADVDRVVQPAEVATFFDRHVKGRLSGLGPMSTRAEVCLYTVTPDHGFVIDRHPEHDNVVIASPCSGHGFKHSAAVGECVAALATSGNPAVDLSGFRLERF